MIGLDLSTLALATGIGAVLVALLGAAMAWSFHTRAARLPAATRLEDVEQRLQIAREELERKQAELAEVERMIQERDRFAAEAEVLRNQIAELQAELKNLEPARAEIEEVKREAAKAAGELTEIETQLSEKREELDEIEKRLGPERIAELERRKEALERELAAIEEKLEPLRAERDAALRVVAEAKQLEARIATLRGEMEELQHEIEHLRDVESELGAKVGELRAEMVQLRQTAEAKQAEVDGLDRDASRLRAEIASLERTLEALEQKLGPVDRETVIADLVREPEVLMRPQQLRAAPRPEAEALRAVAEYLKETGLRYPWRTLAAFHTSLKINEIAQLTVLAGVSGTGKSLLPRRYAEAMGIHFLQIAVEPRWDSPQDLLGFYNYMEGRYRATDLARLMAHLDPWRSIELPEDVPDRREHMALVLLDEMNLARVEYYFSEFLSRLEARPPWREGLTPEQCADAMIPIDVRGLDKPPLLFPAHNILFVGTMNEDETTQSLSDKVLDRSNVLQFPAPQEFALGADASLEPAGEAQRFDEWRTWVKPGSSLDGAAADLTREVIEKLAEIMDGFGRPFGHRLAQAITAYVANYPVEGNAGLDARVPLADQVELRILPKLRGVQIDDFQSQFDELQELIRSRLHDDVFANQLQELLGRQQQGTGLFAWRGVAREAG